MGREIKRVPLDFDWPLNEVWAGFDNPYYTAKDCPHCNRSGYGPDTKRLYDQWYGYAEFYPSMTGSEVLTPKTPAVRAFAERNCSHSPGFYGTSETAIIREAERLCSMWNTQWSHHLDQNDVNALLAEGRLFDLTRNGNPTPTPQQVNEWHILSMGHDSLNAWVCVREKAKRLGYVHLCTYCNGEGKLWDTKAAKMLYEAWKDIEPPTGEGWQVWETVSEGSPISPVFATSDELVAWLIEQGYSKSAADNFVKSEWSPSMMMIDGEVKRDIESLAD
jgi:hypothetical protein